MRLLAVGGLLIATASGCGGSSGGTEPPPVRGGIIARDLPPEEPVDVAVPWARYREDAQGEIDRRYVEKSCAGIDDAVRLAVDDVSAGGVQDHTAIRAYAAELKRRLRCP
jgi:hypothetical protein